MPYRYVSANHCEERPDAYKLCAAGICVGIDVKCPCQMNVEYRCRDGDCISLTQKCDGIKQCSGGEDEHLCPGQLTSEPPSEPISASLVTIVTSLCLLTCILVCLIVGVYFIRRRKNNTSRESQSVTVPLKKKCVVEVSDKYDKCDHNVRSTIVTENHDNEYKQNTRHKLTGSQGSLDNHEYKMYEKWKNSQNKFSGNIGVIHRHNEIYALELENEVKGKGQGQKLGKYMFRPRLKSLDQDVSVNPDDIRLNVALNSYKHFSGKISLPVTFDPEPETFASDLLCASTPRQPIRHLFPDGDSECVNHSEKIALSKQLIVKTSDHHDNEIL